MDVDQLEALAQADAEDEALLKEKRMERKKDPISPSPYEAYAEVDDAKKQ